MKKSCCAALLCVLLAPAVRAAVGGTQFDTLLPGFWRIVGRDDNGAASGDTYWHSDVVNVGVITNFNDLGSYAGQRPPVTQGPYDRCLLLNAGLPLYRTIRPYAPAEGTSGPASFKTVPIDGGFYFDGMVQFKATPAGPQLRLGEKAVVWMRARDGETNLVVTAGFLQMGSGVESRDYVVTNLTDVREDEWHRLTVKAFSDITETGSRTVGLTVYLDGRQACYSVAEPAGQAGSAIDRLNTVAARHYNDAKHALFPSYDRTVTTVSAVAFEGNGAVDDIVFRTDAPAGGFIDDKLVFVLRWTEKVESFSYVYAGRTVPVDPTEHPGRLIEIPVVAGADSLEVINDRYAENYARGACRDTHGEELPDGEPFPVALYHHGTLVASPAVFKDVQNRGYVSFEKALAAIRESSSGYGRLTMNADYVSDDPIRSAVQIEESDDVEVVLDLCGYTLSSSDPGMSVVYVMGGSLTLVDSKGTGCVTGGYAPMIANVQYAGRLRIGDTNNSVDLGVTVEGGLHIEPLSFEGAFGGSLELVRGTFWTGDADARETVLSNVVAEASVASEADGYATVVPDEPLETAMHLFSAGTLTQSSFDSARAGETLVFEGGTPVVDSALNTLTLGETTVTVPDYYDVVEVDGEEGVFTLALNAAADPALATVESSAEDATFRITLTDTRAGLWYGVCTKETLAEAWPEPAAWSWCEGGRTIVFELARKSASCFYAVRVSDTNPLR